MPSLRGTRPRAARQRHRQLRVKGHDWVKQAEVMLGMQAKSSKEEQTDSMKRPTANRTDCNAEKPPPEGARILMYGFLKLEVYGFNN